LAAEPHTKLKQSIGKRVGPERAQVHLNPFSHQRVRPIDLYQEEFMGRNLGNQQVVDLSSVRQERIEERKRDYERVVFRSNFGVYTYNESVGLNAIEVLDISEGGMQFQTAERSSLRLDVGDVIPVRFYFASDHYIAIDVKVVRSFTAIENLRPVHRYGCLMDKSMASYSAIYHFVQFITKCAEHGHKDDQHLKVFY
jgi:hypothetical protein